MREKAGLRPFGCGRRFDPANPHKLPDFVLLSQRHEGEWCPQGNGETRKIKAAGRTYYCLSTEGEVTRKWAEKRNGRSSRNDL